MKPLPKKLTQKHLNARVQISDWRRPAIIRRCKHDDGSYTGAGGLKLDKPDAVFFGSGIIVSMSGNRCLVAFPDSFSNIGLWLDPADLVQFERKDM